MFSQIIVCDNCLKYALSMTDSTFSLQTICRHDLLTQLRSRSHRESSTCPTAYNNGSNHSLNHSHTLTDTGLEWYVDILRNAFQPSVEENSDSLISPEEAASRSSASVQSGRKISAAIQEFKCESFIPNLQNHSHFLCQIDHMLTGTMPRSLCLISFDSQDVIKPNLK